MSLIFPFACVFTVAIIFMILTIICRSKFAVIYSTVSMICWFAAGALSPATFEAAAIPLSYIWYALGVVAELLGFWLSFSLMKADQSDKEMTID